MFYLFVKQWRPVLLDFPERTRMDNSDGSLVGEREDRETGREKGVSLRGLGLGWTKEKDWTKLDRKTFRSKRPPFSG